MLHELATKYHADKLSHGFIDVYGNVFEDKRTAIETMLEIGIGAGCSLQMWRDYFPNAKLFGIDLECYELNTFGPRVTTFVVNQEDRFSLSNFVNMLGPKTKFDIILDDGGHRMPGQQISLGMLWPYLALNGYYIIEDLHTSCKHNMCEFIGGKCLPDFSNSSLLAIKKLQDTGSIYSIYMTGEEMNRINYEHQSCKIYDINNDEHHITSIIRKARIK